MKIQLISILLAIFMYESRKFRKTHTRCVEIKGDCERKNDSLFNIGSCCNGLFCSFGKCEKGKKRIGESCQTNEECQYYCNYGLTLGLAGGNCSKKPDGSECYRGEECESGHCRNSLKSLNTYHCD